MHKIDCFGGSAGVGQNFPPKLNSASAALLQTSKFWNSQAALLLEGAVKTNQLSEGSDLVWYFPGFVTLWKSLENSMFFHIFWKILETSGNIWIWDDFEFSFLEKPGKCLCPEVKNFDFKKKLFSQHSTCCFTYCLDLYPLFLSLNDNWTSKTTEFSVVL